MQPGGTNAACGCQRFLAAVQTRTRSEPRQRVAQHPHAVTHQIRGACGRMVPSQRDVPICSSTSLSTVGFVVSKHHELTSSSSSDIPTPGLESVLAGLRLCTQRVDAGIASYNRTVSHYRLLLCTSEARSSLRPSHVLPRQAPNNACCPQTAPATLLATTRTVWNISSLSHQQSKTTSRTKKIHMSRTQCFALSHRTGS
jgi:hypothetical protein